MTSLMVLITKLGILISDDHVFSLDDIKGVGDELPHCCRDGRCRELLHERPADQLSLLDAVEEILVYEKGRALVDQNTSDIRLDSFVEASYGFLAKYLGDDGFIGVYVVDTECKASPHQLT
jgi:hypothetical protein